MTTRHFGGYLKSILDFPPWITEISTIERWRSRFYFAVEIAAIGAIFWAAWKWPRTTIEGATR